MPKMRSRAMALYIGIAVCVAGLFGASFLGTHHAWAQALSDTERAQLQSQYTQLQKEIAQQQQIIAQTQAQEGNINANITQLNAQIKAAQAQIAAKQLALKQIGSQISQKTATINALSNQIDQGKASLASLLRQEDQIDDFTPVEVALGAQDVSDFFSDLDTFALIQNQMQGLFTTIKTAKAQTETEKEQLAAQQNATADAEHEIQTQQTKVSSAKTSQQQLLAATKGTEAQQKAVLAQKQAEAQAIYARLFNLRDAQGIEFGTAVQYAQAASKATGVRAALILAFLSQESDLGKNVGQCLVTDLSTGNGKGKNTGTPFKGVMKAPRDTVPFQAITSALAIDWSAQPVSCPQSVGYGGAMGPAQFIPSTWQLYAPRIAKALGIGGAEPDPWNAQAAIMANALYIADLGAGAGTYTAEKSAACHYFSGQSCSASATINGYGVSVVNKADAFQADIDCLNNNATCSAS
jgi:peptidoglycan hydrolase CwlO-like protein